MSNENHIINYSLMALDEELRLLHQELTCIPTFRHYSRLLAVRDRIKNQIENAAMQQYEGPMSSAQWMAAKFEEAVQPNDSDEITTTTDVDALMKSLDPAIPEEPVMLVEPTEPVKPVKIPRPKRGYKWRRSVNALTLNRYGDRFKKHEINLINCCLNHIFALDDVSIETVYISSEQFLEVIRKNGKLPLLGGKQNKNNVSALLSASGVFVPHNKKGWSLPPNQ